jgi:K+-transporting ATPase KdpF subunit
MDEPRNVAGGDVSFGSCGNGPVLSLHEGLRKDLRREAISMMIYVTLAVVAFLFVYLVIALLRPEWF